MENEKNSILNSEEAYSIIKDIELNPEITQRFLAQKHKISLGKTNFILKALIDKGIIKATNFKNSNNKIAYMYVLTPEGIKTKTVLAANFIKRKVTEYERLKIEIETLKNEVENNESNKYETILQ
ncbi:MAG: MarR family EPS-associated transcriptional regulator [Candidatus Ancaeobacter aquaticus]|nr:MarR family EPS-associated transcriptional regulator [Candidatus Ancaeobacter aquaticus]